MSNKEIDVVAGFKTHAGASNAVDRLVADGFDQQNVSLVMGEDARKQFVTLQDGNKGLEGAATGGAAGGAAGAIIAGLAGLATLAIPGFGIVIAGPLVAALAGGGAGAAAGGIVGGLVGLGMDKHEAVVYEDAIKTGGVLVAVRCAHKKDAKRAKGILREVGAMSVEQAKGQALHS